jgi:hypothetical protein
MLLQMTKNNMSKPICFIVKILVCIALSQACAKITNARNRDIYN